MIVRVVGFGRLAGGDDAVGLAVVERLRASGVPPGVDVVSAPDPGALLSLLEGAREIVVVDAVVGPGPEGDVIELDAAELRWARDRPLSTHGLELAAVIELARVLFDAPPMTLVGVRIAPSASLRPSQVIEAAVGRAAEVVLARVGRA